MSKTGARITIVAGLTGGLGASTAARALAHALGGAGLHAALVDADPETQGQRAFHHLRESDGLERAYGPHGVRDALVSYRRTGAAYLLLPGPMDPEAHDLPDRYGHAVTTLARTADQIVIDIGRLTPARWHDRDAIAGGLARTLAGTADARLLCLCGQSDTQRRIGLATLRTPGLPGHTLLVAQTPYGIRPRPRGKWRADLDGLARYAGSDRWDNDGYDMIERGEPGWERGAEPDWLRHAALWCGADPEQFKGTEGRWPWRH